MKPYLIILTEHDLTHNRGGVCPHCKRRTGWHVRRMGVIPNLKDPELDAPHEAAITALEKQGYTASKRGTTPGILVNKCMACNKTFYDWVCNYDSRYESTHQTHVVKGLGLYRILPQEIPSNIPCSNPDLPQNCKDLYEEAAHIFSASPRSAAVILRLCLQDLLNSQGFSGTIYQMIGKATEKLNLPQHIQQFMEVVRFHGNEAAHNSDLELNPDEQAENVAYMFTIINDIATYAITLPKKAQAEYEKLPDAVRQSIEQRQKQQ